MTESDRAKYRLPRTVVPSHYELTLEPNLEAATFAGTVRIDVDIAEAVDEIVLNAVDLEIQGAWLEAGGNRSDLTPSFDTETERCHLALTGEAPIGSASLHLAFTGVLNDKLVGFYRSTFKDDQGVERLIATTQMEAPHARRAFPCWDEPEFKASFAVTLTVPADLTALSNGAEVSSVADGDKKVVTFAKTMKMSTYLVAFIVGPLLVTAPTDVDGTPLRIAYPPGKGKLTDFALESGSFALRFYNNYYGIPYPSDKLDMAAIPDFAFGAMENLGCITYRETALLIDPTRATQPELQRVADVVHHEIAHMWFGDLVTMKWWNGIWLNEAFATFMEMKCTDAFHPEWKRWVDFGLSRTAAFDVDSLESTRPIEFEVVSPEDAEGMFDILTYEKGAAVLLMLEQYLGEDPFMDGVRKYLNENAYGNTETTDLWDAIEAATSQPVRQIMDTWIFQGGYPILSAGIDGATLTMTQRRFRYRGDDLGEQWLVPALVRYGAGDKEATGKFLIDDRTASFELEFAPEWVVVNARATGFYRVSYSAELLGGLAKLGSDALSALERYQLLDDAYASMLAGLSSPAEFFKLAQTFSDETDLSVWERLAGALGTLNRIVDDSARERYRDAVRHLIGPALGRLGTEPEENENERDNQLRGTLFELMGNLGNSEASLSLARTLHADYLEDPDGVDPALAAAATQIIAEHGTAEDFDLYWKRHQETDNPQLKTRYLFSLARFNQPELIDRLLELALTEVRTQDAPFLLRGALANRTQGPRAWKFISTNWERVKERFPPNLLIRMFDGIRSFTDPDLASEVEQFFVDHPQKQGEKTLAQHLEKMRVNVGLKQRESEDFSSSLG